MQWQGFRNPESDRRRLRANPGVRADPKNAPPRRASWKATRTGACSAIERNPMDHVQADLKRRQSERGYASAAAGEKSAKGGSTTFSKVQT